MDTSLDTMDYPLSIFKFDWNDLRTFFLQDGDKTAGINVKRGVISSMQDENVLQPALVTSNVIQLASETVCSILKIDDIVNTIR